MASAINQLSVMLYSVLPVRPIRSKQSLENFMTPEGQKAISSHISEEERAAVQTLLDIALSLWGRIEEKFFNSIDIDKETFIENFSKSIETHNLHESLKGLSGKCYAVVQNLEWINAFAWQMPIMDPKNHIKYRMIAQCMMGIFFLEKHQTINSNALASTENNRIYELIKMVY